jgi:hypothetical protein
LIVFDASTLVGSALKAGSTPERALHRALKIDVLALSTAVDGEIAEVLSRPNFARILSAIGREHFPEALRRSAIWFDPTVDVTDCHDAKNNKYLELALAAGVETIIGSDEDLLVLHPWRGVAILFPAAFLAQADEVIE